MLSHWKRIVHYCLAVFVLASCAAAPVTPTLGQARPTVTLRLSPVPYEPTAAVPVAGEFELLTPGGLASEDAPPGVDLDVTFISRDPMYYMYCVEYPDDLPQI
ncbi:MAG: hypothetical protein MUC85_08215, partial [Anaerolineales bacterium]|nr:hypothetical protein [Anaerolineales bacterium]